MLYKMTEWKSASGKWYCNCVDDLAGTAGLWQTPARILDLTPAAYVKFVVEHYHPDVYYNEEKCLVFFSWKDQSQMREFKRFINKKAREKNFQI